jgi:acetylornithine deacetylase
MSNQASPETLRLLEQLVAFETISERSNLDLVDWVKSLLLNVDARIRLSFDNSAAKANILASFGPQVAGGIVISGHTDVVPVAGQKWSSDPFRMKLSDGKAFGRGTCDMKGFLAASLSIVLGARLSELKMPLHLALSYDEEIGHLGVPHLIKDMLANEPKPKVAIIGEPTEMRCGLTHRGTAVFKSSFVGKPAHAGNPRLGVNAIHGAAEFVSFLRVYEDQLDRDQTGATLNVGMVRGGEAINIVAGACDVFWEVRSANAEQTRKIRLDIENYFNTAKEPYSNCQTTALRQTPPLTTSDDTVTDFMGRLGIKITIPQLPFSTEAGHFQAAGIASAVCGPGSIAQAHQADEWISCDQLHQAEALMSRVMALCCQ